MKKISSTSHFSSLLFRSITCAHLNTRKLHQLTRSTVINTQIVPTTPLNPRVVDFMLFSATLQWDPLSDNGGSSLPLTYTVILTNTSTSLPFSNITATSLPLPHLQHSTQYSWSVQACFGMQTCTICASHRAAKPLPPFHFYMLTQNGGRKGSD